MSIFHAGEMEKVSLENIKNLVVGYEVEVPLLDGSTRRYINFDNAASTPVLKPVMDALNAFMSYYSSIHRGTGFKSQLCSELYDYSREVVADFVNADLNYHTVIYGKNTTEAINKLARRVAVGPDQLVLVSLMEHHSNDLPWRKDARVIHIAVDKKGRLIEADLIDKLEKYKGKVAIFAVTGASNVTGWVNDVHRLAETVHRYDVPILVDAAQLAPHRKIDMGSPDDPRHIDFLAFSAHKMYAPFGTGVLIGPKMFFEQGDPDLVGGGTIDVVGLDYVHWAEVPEKDEAGSPNVVGSVALAKVIKVLEAIGMDAIARHEARLTAYALKQLREVPGIEIYGGDDPADVKHRLGVISFNLRGLYHAKVAAILNYEGGIGVRNGCFCAHPYLKHLMGIDEAAARKMEAAILKHDRSNIPGGVRISFGIYNDEAEIDIFMDVLHRIARKEWKGTYELNRYTGEYHPIHFKVDYQKYFWI